MQVTELDSFVQKFQQLWKSGITAHLDLDTHAGYAWVGLRAQLGHVPPGPPHVPTSQPRHRGPSYWRRQQKRQAARVASPQASPGTLPATEEVCDEVSIVEKAVEAATNNEREENSAEKVEDNLQNQQSNENAVVKATVHEEEVDSDLECPICDFKSSWKNGLRVHMSRKHKTIIQIDGSADDEETDAKYANTEHYWRKSWLGISYHVYLDANMIIDTCDDLSNEEKEKVKARLLEVRKKAFGSNFSNFPPWSRS